MTDGADEFRTRVETKVAAEFGAERDAERVAEAAVRVREAGVEWSPTFIAERMADAPKDASVSEKWNWLLGYVGGPADAEEYRLGE
ncbi:hypothetical protein M0R89_13055 [Halorussus limi]|uniref:Uncharacterized protein n=1 Tax=Halorussus limi TaxID=2938695 RepID=A0A8U0HRF7_9EURY|nr:hypothetical protein [Halorussus limi]UPV73468.1 hypothetical protein M0R89_13055 [Halorussus limi]